MSSVDLPPGSRAKFWQYGAACAAAAAFMVLLAASDAGTRPFSIIAAVLFAALVILFALALVKTPHGPR